MSKEDNENYSDEEYHFAIDPDDIEKNEDVISEDLDEPAKSKFDLSKYIDVEKIKTFLNENIQVRNAIIAGLVLVFLIIIYQVTSGFVSKNSDNKSSQKLNSLDNVKLQPTPSSAIIEDTFAREKNMINQSLTKVRENQDVINSKIATLSADNSKMIAEYQDLSDKVNKLAMQIEQLSKAVEEQSQSIMSLSIRRDYHPRQAHRQHVVRPNYMKYFVKAVIPGRAWLIGENGSTLTVRKGSIIPGYGVVTMVDVSQGRVLTNSGKIITFGQNDS